MQNENDSVLERFRNFRKTFISSNIPNNLLMDMIESFITSGDEDTAAEPIPVLDGQLSFFESA